MSNTCTKVEGLKLKRRTTCPRLYWEDLLPQEQRELDYYQEDGGLNFFRFKGQVYDLCQIGRFDHSYWHGSDMHSAWSGVLVHVCSDGDSVTVASYYS
jgi:hypothetical protein